MAEVEGGGGQSAASKGTWDKYANHIIGAMALATFAIGTVVYHVLEDWSWIDSFYFSAVALTTVGFGDFAPTTDGSKLFTVFYIFVGVSLVALVLNQFLKQRLATRADRRVSEENADVDE